MKIFSIDITTFSSSRMVVMLDNATLSVDLAEEERNRFLELGTEIFTSRQKAIAHEIETTGPMLLTAEAPKPVPVYDDDSVLF